ncbi:MAG: PAS domain S-box protein [Candidatus Schekmanbacteria bacterium]|nr:MAG: PAS domain S-box protein [Candidatus Schekmanbacteria bacterium]
MASHHSIVEGDKNCDSQLAFFYERMKDYILSLRRIDENGIVTHFYPKEEAKNIIGTNVQNQTYFNFCRIKGVPYLSNKLTHENNEKKIHFAIPLFETTKKNRKVFKGILTVDFPLQWVTDKFASSSTFQKSGYITIFDSNGTLLSHSRHPEMVYNNIFSRSKKCYECHTSFESLEAMINKGDGVFRYSVKGESEKYLSATTISLPGQKWTVVFNVPVSEIQVITKNALKQTLILIILTIATIALGIFLVMKIKKERETAGLLKNSIAETTEAKEMLEKVIQSSVDGILIVEKTGMITECNEAAINILGYSKDELKKMHTSMLASPDSASLQKRREALEELFAKGKVKTHETLWKRKNGEIFPVESTNSLFKDKNGDYCGGIIIFRDITEKKQMEEALVDAQRLAAVGEIGITLKHEINNPLGGILGYSELILKHKENLTEKDRKRVEEIHKMAMRIRDVISNIEQLKSTQTVDYVDGVKMIKLENNRGNFSGTKKVNSSS